MTVPIQVPTIGAALVRMLDLSAHPHLELEQIVTPVVVVGSTAAAAASASSGSPSFSPATLATAINPEWYSMNVGVVAGVGVTGAAMLINSTAGVVVLRRVRASAAAAQAWNLGVLQEGHGLVPTIAASARDTRLTIGATRPLMGHTITTNPAVGQIVDVDTTLAGQLAVRFTTPVVLGPGGLAYVRPDAFNVLYFAFFEFELWQ